MVDQTLLLQALSEFAHTLSRPYPIGDVLYELVERTSSILGIAGAGVSLIEDDRIRFVTAVNEAASRVEQLQEETQEGPCTEASRTGKVVLVADLRDVDGRWEVFRDAALEVGFVGMAGIPMTGQLKSLGALDLYADEPHVWSEDEIAAAQVLADMATGYLINASELEQAQRTAEQLRQALESRVVIEQAKGILAADRQISIDEAFRMLRRHARNHNADLRSVAEAVVNLGLRPRNGNGERRSG